MKKVTVGQLIQEHDAKNIGLEDSVQEYTAAMSPEIMQTIYETVEAAKKTPSYAGKNFYIQVFHFVEPIFRKPIVKVFARFSCPTPGFNQSTFKYYAATDDLRFLFTLPEKDIYQYIVDNAREFLDDPVRRSIAEFVFADKTGELLKFVQKENGDKPDAVIYNCKERACITKKLNN